MDDLVQELVSDFKNGFLTRRGFLAKAAGLGLSAAGALALLGAGGAQVASAQGQVPGGSGQAPGRSSRRAGSAGGAGAGYGDPTMS